MSNVRPEKLQEVELRLRNLGVRAQDLVESFVRGSGPGGQKINKTSVVVQLRHLPSGIEIKVQETRSQATNRFLARRKLAERLEALTDEAQDLERQRVEKIRRQKRKRSKRAKEKMLADKRHQSEKKGQRRTLEE